MGSKGRCVSQLEMRHVLVDSLYNDINCAGCTFEQKVFPRNIKAGKHDRTSGRHTCLQNCVVIECKMGI